MTAGAPGVRGFPAGSIVGVKGHGGQVAMSGAGDGGLGGGGGGGGGLLGGEGWGRREGRWSEW